MKVAEVCAKLASKRETDVRMATAVVNPPIVDQLTEAGTAAFLKDNGAELVALLGSATRTPAKVVGQLEMNAFLCAAQRAYEDQSRTRMHNWALVYTQLNRQIASNGVLRRLLPNIGIKVDDELLSNTLQAERTS